MLGRGVDWCVWIEAGAAGGVGRERAAHLAGHLEGAADVEGAACCGGQTPDGPARGVEATRLLDVMRFYGSASSYIDCGVAPRARGKAEKRSGKDFQRPCDL